MAHVLVVGGTGMLRGVCLYFCRSGQTVSVIARSQSGLDDLTNAADNSAGKINPIQIDYRNSQELSNRITQAVNDHGPIETAVCWIHSSVAPDAAKIIAGSINKSNRQGRNELYLLLSSATADPSREKIDLSHEFSGFDKISLHTILLGFRIEQDQSRWLTDEEICGGVIDAIENNRESTVIGTVKPWDKRP